MSRAAAAHAADAIGAAACDHVLIFVVFSCRRFASRVRFRNNNNWHSSPVIFGYLADGLSAGWSSCLIVECLRNLGRCALLIASLYRLKQANHFRPLCRHGAILPGCRRALATRIASCVHQSRSSQRIVLWPMVMKDVG